MRKLLPIAALFIAILVINSCNPPGTPLQLTAPNPSNTAPLPTAPIQLPTPTPPLANVSCNELSFYLPPALGSSYTCETVPENDGSGFPPTYYVFTYPAHTELTIQDYPLTDTQFPARIWIYPVSRFSELLPDLLPNRVSHLERLISTGIWSNGVLPFLPAIPEQQSFYVHETVMPFNSGQGVRFITEYSEGLNPISNQNIIYTFQGLTDDGKYWVAVTLPISSPLLPVTYDSLPEGYTEESLIANYSSYVSDTKGSLQAQEPGSFSPTIDSLDSLIKSITVR